MSQYFHAIMQSKEGKITCMISEEVVGFFFPVHFLDKNSIGLRLITKTYQNGYDNLRLFPFEEVIVISTNTLAFDFVNYLTFSNCYSLNREQKQALRIIRDSLIFPIVFIDDIHPHGYICENALL